MQSPGSADILVLGAGIAGCALAYHLTELGHNDVLVYDPRTPAAGASGRAAGVLTEQLWDRWDVQVARETHLEYAELCRRWDPEAYRRNGFVRLTRNPEAVAVLDRTRERLRSWGVPVEEAGEEELHRWVPEGRYDDVLGALYSPNDGCVTPSAITTIYAEAARRAGARFDFGQPTVSLARAGSRWALKTPAGIVSARRLVVAAGAWTKAILGDLGHPLPLSPYRTQAALLRPPKAPSEGFPTIHDIDTDVYVRPENRGRILGGDGTEHVEADPDRFVPGGDASFLEHLATSLTDRFPGWADSEVVSSWAGVCTSTLDRRPIVGAMPGAPELYVMTGFNGFGVMRAGGTARRLARLLVEGTDSIAAREALAPVRPGRFTAPVVPFVPRPGFTLEAGDHPRF